MLDPAEQKALIKDTADQLLFKRLFFCLEKVGLSVLKLVLLQFKKDTKEQVYLQTLIEQKMTVEELERIIQFLFKDRVLTCISNFAYSKSQLVVGDSQAAHETSQKWLRLEDLAMVQIQTIDQEVEDNIVLIEQK
jgi:predicted nuclease of restriction endonuclease-like (RecB) superfamily